MSVAFSASQLEAISAALRASWSSETSVCFNPEIASRSYGQCAPTAIVIFEHFGGEILKTEVPKRNGGSARHFYNRINGTRFDFTKDQFDIPDYWCELEYRDDLSSVSEALAEMLPGQIEAMRAAFKTALKTSSAAQLETHGSW